MQTLPWHTNVDSLRQVGFEGFKTIGELRDSRLAEVPRLPGVYVITREDRTAPVFLPVSTGGWFKKKDPNVGQEILVANWVKETPVIYVGKAGSSTGAATLRSRLKQYFDFGNGKAVGHWGGRFIWHLPDSGKLKVGWMPTPGKEPVEVEQEMIREFTKHYGARPFANLRD